MSQQTPSMNFNQARWAAAVSWEISRPAFTMKQRHSYCTQEGKLRDQNQDKPLNNMTALHIVQQSRWSFYLKISKCLRYSQYTCTLYTYIKKICTALSECKRQSLGTALYLVFCGITTENNSLFSSLPLITHLPFCTPSSSCPACCSSASPPGKEWSHQPMTPCWDMWHFCCYTSHLLKLACITLSYE